MAITAETSCMMLPIQLTYAPKYKLYIAYIIITTVLIPLYTFILLCHVAYANNNAAITGIELIRLFIVNIPNAIIIIEYIMK